MERLKLFLRIFSGCLTAVLTFVGIYSADGGQLVNKAVCFAVATAEPLDISTLFVDDSDGNPTHDDYLEKPFVDTENKVQTGADGGDSTVQTATVEQTVIGNIVKKTLTPYNANTSFGKVFVNNQSGAKIDIEGALSAPLSFSVTPSSEPQILIYHTHATEGFMADESEYLTNRDEPRSTDTEINIVKVGEVIANKLTEAGFAVVHDKTLHDHPGYTGSYSRSAETVKAALKKYPSIKIAIDVHRDSIAYGKSDKVAPVVSVGGKEAAQVMLVMGSETGAVEDYPDWRKNLQLAQKLQFVFESSYPGFARALLLRSAKYNQDLTAGSILIEVGSDANTLEQALYSAELVGRSLVLLLESQ
ncbi:MAG: stage II sporulation protein P [Clostridia bacterium]|nr:stage II sporulation protein P [Clostridia bacterium]